MRLYSYFRSSASYRVRIALNLKGLRYTAIPVHLLRGGGEQLSASFTRMNPAQLVPVLEDEQQGVTIPQSLAIMEYLDEMHPSPPLLPGPPAARAHVRALALAIACDIHPLNNLRVRRYLKHALGQDEARLDDWSRHWIELGFEALERQLSGSDHTGQFCFGDAPTLADCCLIPQMANAQRLALPLTAFPTLCRIQQACERLPAFAAAAPGAQPDAE